MNTDNNTKLRIWILIGAVAAGIWAGSIAAAVAAYVALGILAYRNFR